MADQGSEGFLSPFLRERRIRAALPYLRGTVLDFGCGSGALAAWISPANYFGMDRDAEALAAARRRFPAHRFSQELPESAAFDTIAALAVLEHLPSPAAWLLQMRRHLAPGGQIVLTTPHPSVRLVHEAGARAGLFSRAAAEEHEQMLNGADLLRLARQSGFRLVRYRRFLLGANQLAVLQPAGSGD